MKQWVETLRSNFQESRGIQLLVARCGGLYDAGLPEEMSWCGLMISAERFIERGRSLVSSRYRAL